jgi:hypothetical protein
MQLNNRKAVLFVLKMKINKTRINKRKRERENNEIALKISVPLCWSLCEILYALQTKHATTTHRASFLVVVDLASFSELLLEHLKGTSSS